MDLSQLNSILGPANAALSREMNFIRQYKSQGLAAFNTNQYPSNQQQQQQPGGYYPPPGFGYWGDPMGGWGWMPPPPMQAPGYGPMPPSDLLQAMYLPQQSQNNSMQMIQTMLIQRLLEEKGIDLDNSGLSESQLALLKAFYPGLFPSESSTGPSAAVADLKDLIKQQSDEEDGTDTDDDGYMVSVKDLQRLKEGMEEKDYTEADLKTGFQYVLATVSSAKTDELLALFTLAEQDGLVKTSDLLQNNLIDQLNETKRNLLVHHVANQGLADHDGKANTKVATYLLAALDANAPSKMATFAKDTIKELVTTWIKPEVADTDPDRQQLVRFLHLAGFEFNEDGSLKTDSHQPFPIGLPDPEEDD